MIKRGEITITIYHRRYTVKKQNLYTKLTKRNQQKNPKNVGALTKPKELIGCLVKLFK
jgi:hypothetical protein